MRETHVHDSRFFCEVRESHFGQICNKAHAVFLSLVGLVQIEESDLPLLDQWLHLQKGTSEQWLSW